MSSRADRCLAKAVKCERAAKLATDDGVRNAYVDLAKQWKVMAQDAKYIDRRQGRNPHKNSN